ncbi:MAG: ribosome recycling factor [Candidatus Pacebacteria bacterium]|nr:ribosome recycling factor [Candidatus Paceibacterota bacterium]
MDIKEFDINLKNTVVALQTEIGGVRSNRPTTSLVENIEVLYMDGKFPVKQLGSITIQPPRDIIVSPWDVGSLPAVAKAIENSPLKMSPQIEGNIIRLKIPAISEERRDELVKFVRQISEKTRIRIRSLRDDANKRVEGELKLKTITEDQKFKMRENIQKSVDRVNMEVEKIISLKEKELLEN